MKLVVVRHGQTDWNAEDRYQGQLDIPLNDTGRRQADALKQQLSGMRFDAAYSSPLRRAFETAQIIVSELEVVSDERLAEIHHGEWQGRTRSEIAREWPDAWDRWSREPHGFTPPGGEAASRVRARVEDFLKTVQGTTILCVSHGFVIQTFLSILNSDPRIPDNGSVHEFVL
jgi:broad specificity phosphatase PhoE